ncbi:DUF3280 domain-containing protein [Rhodomicrobium sp. Az07]|uniref:DUF3280 domain-containing protein n=1 Tax=Rhodomicrobium sp. Az07 TaxID=2839034 RepID=UPI001BE686B9|nr:DUF3280 domain-containing protein [Rhodomicrobium sp. Az07]MBT3069904.1 DUF3280 domain-containing protein [Rhodomicrobium sp. Az07]
MIRRTFGASRRAAEARLMPVFAIALALSLCFSAASLAAQRVAVFDFEIVDAGSDAASLGSRPAEAERLKSAAARMRDALVKSGKFEMADLTPVEPSARAFNLSVCSGCDGALARKVDAVISITGTVQKVQEVPRAMAVFVRDVETGKLIASRSVDIREDTDAGWNRAVDDLASTCVLSAETEDN